MTERGRNRAAARTRPKNQGGTAPPHPIGAQRGRNERNRRRRVENAEAERRRACFQLGERSGAQGAQVKRRAKPEPWSPGEATRTAVTRREPLGNAIATRRLGGLGAARPQGEAYGRAPSLGGEPCRAIWGEPRGGGKAPKTPGARRSAASSGAERAPEGAPKTGAGSTPPRRLKEPGRTRGARGARRRKEPRGGSPGGATTAPDVGGGARSAAMTRGQGISRRRAVGAATAVESARSGAEGARPRGRNPV